MAPSDAVLRLSPLARLWQNPVGRGLLCAAGLCISAYWSVMTLSVLLLNTGGIGWLVACNTDDAHVELGRAYSPWPGRVVYRDLHVEVHDSASHFDLRIARGEVEVDLAALLRRRFEGRHVKGEGARVQIRLAEAYRSAEREARLPRLSAPKQPGEKTRAEDLWGVAVGIDSLRLDEVWIDDARVEGSLVISGGFDLQPLRYLTLTDSRIQLKSCELWLGASQVTQDLEGTVEARLPRTPVDQQAGERLSKRADITTKLAAKVADVAPLSLYLGDDWSLFGGEGTLSVAGRLRNQELADGSHFNYQSPQLGVRWKSVTAAGASMLTLSQHAQPQASWTLRDIDLRRAGKRKSTFGHVTTCRLHVDAEGPLSELGVASAKLDVEGVSVPDVADLPLELPAKLQRLQGAAKGDFHLGYAGGQLRVDTSAQARGLRVETDELRLRGDAWLSASATARPPFRDLAVSQLSLDLRSASVALTDTKHSKPFHLALATTRYRFNWKTREADGALQVELSDSQPLERVTGADVPGVAESLFGLQGLRLLVQTELSPSVQDVKILRGSSGRSRLEGRLVRRDKGARLVLLLSRGPLSVGIAAWPGGSSVVPLAGDDWLHEQLSRI
ncbi:MAG: hypothetical protein R3B07_18035 [Polyangiaceae bacterium]